MDISVFYFTPLSKVSIDLSSSLQARTSLKDQTHHLNHSLGQIPRAKSQSFSPLVLVTFRADNSLWLGVRRWTATLCIVAVQQFVWPLHTRGQQHFSPPVRTTKTVSKHCPLFLEECTKLPPAGTTYLEEAQRFFTWTIHIILSTDKTLRNPNLFPAT